MSRPEEQGLRWRRRVTDNGCVYGFKVVGRRYWKRQWASFLSDWTFRKSGGDTVVQSRKTYQDEWVSYSGGGGGGGQKGKLVKKIDGVKMKIDDEL